METERALKQEIIKSADAVKRKVKQIRNNKTESNIALDTMFKPITDSINQIVSNKTPEKNNEIVTKENEILKYRDIKRPHFSDQYEDDIKHDKTILDFSSTSEDNVSSDSEQCENDDSFKTINSDAITPSRDSLSWSMTSGVYENVPFGVRIERGKHMMGTARVTLSDHSVTIGGQKYLKSPGLSELLFNKTPNLDLINNDDLENYKKILLSTNAHRRDFDPRKPIKSNKGRKYINIIKPLFKNERSCTTSTENLAEGSGLPLMKRMKKNTDFIYWDDPNELIDRLKLLVASRDAGNTGVDGEIISILKELRESGYID